MLISIVLCSRDSQAAQWVVQNLKRTATKPHQLEFLVMDNSKDPHGICWVYNQAATQAQGELVVFMHEDVYMVEKGWDQILIEKFAQKPPMGMLGVAGSRHLPLDPPLWAKAGPPYTFGKVIHELDGGREYFLTIFNADEGDQRVVALDGLWFAVRASALRSYGFDSNNFPGFHFYDVDFCLQIAEAWEIWVTTDIRVKHLSAGNFGEDWINAAKVLKDKWQDQWPHSLDVGPHPPPPGSQRIENVNLKGKASQITWI